jgi:hypothetical protein
MKTKSNTFKRLSLLAMLAVLAVLLAPLSATYVSAAPAAQTTSCTGFTHCYGVTGWSGNATGVITYVDPPVSYSSSSNRLSEEMWLYDLAHSCTAGPNCHPWVELGVYTGGSSGQSDCPYDNCFFYAYMVPMSSTLVDITVTALDSGDYNIPIQLQVTRYGYSSPTIYLAAAGNVTGFSTTINNSMGGTGYLGDYVVIGSELAYGGSGSYPTNGLYWVTWGGNQWQDQYGAYSYQTASGDYKNNGAYHHAQWATDPSQSSTGGVWEDRCCYTP